MARQHPGETFSSYVMEGLLSFLVSESFEQKFLSKLCVFQVIPMMNVEGVIHGNNRCDLEGRDMNRCWG